MRSDVLVNKYTTVGGWNSLRLPHIADRTYKWYPSDSPEQYLRAGNTLYGENDITYKMNSYGYRCDEFSDEPGILFIGCSNTIGIGLPLEETWSWKLKCIAENASGRKLRYYNLAHGGKSMDYITRTLWLSRHIVKPLITIVLSPPASRMELCRDDGMRDVVDPMNDPHLFSEKEKVGISNLLVRSQMLHRTAQFLSQINLQVSPLIWGNWGLWADDLAEFRRITSNQFEHNRINTLFTVDCKARDGMHPGWEANVRFAEAIFDQFSHEIIRSIK